MGTKNDTQGRRGKRPCLPIFLAPEIPASLCTTFSCLPRSKLAVAKLCDFSQAGLGSVGFQTCRIAYSLKSAGREVAPAVGLEICVAAAP